MKLDPMLCGDLKDHPLRS